MASQKIKEYKPQYVTDEKGEYYIIKIKFKDKDIPILIDLPDYESFSEYNWHALAIRGEPKYIARMIKNVKEGKRKRELLHHHIMGIKPSTSLDHINRNGFDCRRTNLRIATPAENMRNSIKRKKSTSKYKGVCWKKINKKWVAQISYKEKTIYLGSFSSEVINGTDEGEIKAAKAYDKAAQRYFGAFALLNMPSERKYVETEKGEYYKRQWLFNEKETKIIESRITDLKELKHKEIMEILEAMDLKDIVDTCHYFGCGIEELIREIKKGKVIGKKHAG